MSEYDPWPQDLCPRCGWHVSSHGSSHGPSSDCPWGASPAARAHALPAPASRVGGDTEETT